MTSYNKIFFVTANAKKWHFKACTIAGGYEIMPFGGESGIIRPEAAFNFKE